VVEVIRAAQARLNASEAQADLAEKMLLRNLEAAAGFGCLDTEGMAALREGNAATIPKGQYQGDVLSVAQIIPQLICPELEKCVANLRLCPSQRGAAKGDRLDDEQLSWARELHEAGLLSPRGLRAVERAAR
jgi:hypothetical protein